MSQQRTMGAYLRAARRKRRVSIETAAEDTRIRSDFLMRMESDEFDFLAPAYVRGFLRTYTRYLNLRTEPFLEEFDRVYGSPSMEPSQIVALDRRSKRAPRQRRRPNNWALAAIFGAIGLIILAFIGFLSGNDRERPERKVALLEASESPTPTETVLRTLGPTPTPTTGATIALTEGLEVEIVASEADCWVDVTADGAKQFSDTMELGDSQTFTAESDMTLILGFPEGVELIVNGQNIGSPGGVDPITIKLPDDFESLL